MSGKRWSLDRHRVLIVVGLSLIFVPWAWASVLNAQGALGYVFLTLISIGLVTGFVGAFLARP